MTEAYGWNNGKRTFPCCLNSYPIEKEKGIQNYDSLHYMVHVHVMCVILTSKCDHLVHFSLELCDLLFPAYKIQ